MNNVYILTLEFKTKNAFIPLQEKERKGWLVVLLDLQVLWSYSFKGGHTLVLFYELFFLLLTNWSGGYDLLVFLLLMYHDNTYHQQKQIK